MDVIDTSSRMDEGTDPRDGGGRIAFGTAIERPRTMQEQLSKATHDCKDTGAVAEDAKADDSMDGGVRATQDAKAEVRIDE